MDLIFDAARAAIQSILSGDREVLAITLLSLEISLAATCVSMVTGVTAGTFIALREFPGRGLVVSLVNTGMGVPPVVVGLVVTILLWRSGPLGGFELLYTPAAIIIGQVVIATPVVTGISMAAMQQLHPDLRLQILALGATRVQTLWMLVREARLPLLAAVMAGFGSIISEVGAAIMLGGNIKGHTRVLTTATVMETGKGNFDIARSLGFTLLAIAFAVNGALSYIQQRGRRR